MAIKLHKWVCSAAVFSALATSPARAGQVTCLWNGLSPATQDAMIHVKSANITAPIPNLSPAEAQSVVFGCSLTKATIPTAGKALNAYALELAEKQKTDGEIFPATTNVEVVWRELSSDERASFREWIVSRKPHPGLDSNDLFHYAIVLRPLGVPPEKYAIALTMPKYVNAMTYFMARAVREELESKF